MYLYETFLYPNVPDPVLEDWVVNLFQQQLLIYAYTSTYDEWYSCSAAGIPISLTVTVHEIPNLLCRLAPKFNHVLQDTGTVPVCVYEL